MRPPLRIAVLECDTPVGHTAEKYGSYGNVFRALLESGAKMLAEEDHGVRPELEISKYDVVNAEHYPDLDEIDACLLTGSRHDSFRDHPWILKLVDFTKKVLAQDRVRLIGVCFGHQIIGRAMNVEVGRNDGQWEIAVLPVQLSDTGKRLFRLDSLNIHQMHQDIVYTYPPGVERLGQTSKCDVQGMYVKNRLITVQGHPEFNCDIVSEITQRRHDQGIFTAQMYDDAMSRVDKPHDGVVVGAAFIRFLLED